MEDRMETVRGLAGKIKEKYWQTLPRQEGLGRMKLPIWATI